MRESGPTRSEFLDRVLTSSFPDQVARRFVFADGEVGALYTMGLDPSSGQPAPVVLYVASFPPAYPQAGWHDFGLDFREQAVATPAEAARLLAGFDRVAAARFRISCRPQPGPTDELAA